MKIQSGPEEASHINELDSRIVDDEPQIAPVEELKRFGVGPHDSSKSLQVRKSLPPALKEKLKNFL